MAELSQVQRNKWGDKALYALDELFSFYGQSLGGGEEGIIRGFSQGGEGDA